MSKLSCTGLLLVLAASGCKPPAGSSSVQSLDNFAAGKRVKQNFCEGNPELADHKGLDIVLGSLATRIDWDTNKPREPLKKALFQSFSAIPPDLQSAFLTLRGRVLITDNPNAVCTDMDRQQAADSQVFKESELKALSEDLNKVSSCYLFSPPSVFRQVTKTDGQLLTIVVAADDKEIHHAFVRSVGYLVSQMLSHVVFTKDDSRLTYISEENPTFVQKKSLIARAFLADVKGTEHAGRFAKYLDNGGASLSEKEAFSSFVYAEAFDSYYCNGFAKDDKNTRNVMKKTFPNSYKAFLGLAAGDQFIANNLAKGAPLGDVDGAVRLGTVKAHPKVRYVEKLYTASWLKEAISSAPQSLKSRGDESSDTPSPEDNKEGLNLWNPLSAAWTAASETVTGAGLLYGEYYDSVYKATGDRLNATTGNGRTAPTVSQQAMAIVGGVSDGTGYTNYYDNTQAATQKRIDAGQSTLKAVTGGVSDEVGYTKKYHEIYNRTENISNQVRSVNPNPDIWTQASIVANGAAADLEKVPGKVGDLMGTATNLVRGGTGAGFDEQGNLQEYSDMERAGFAAKGVWGVADNTGATDWAKGKLTERVSTTMDNWSMSGPGLKQQIGSTAGSVEVIGEAYKKAAKASKPLQQAEEIATIVKTAQTTTEVLTPQ